MKSEFTWEAAELETIECPECACNHNSPILRRLDGLSIVRCTQCQLAYVSPQPTTKELSRFYEHAYFGGNSDFHRGANYFDKRRQSIDSGRVTGASLLKTLNLSGLRIVEVGAADGALLAWCRQRGAKSVTGIEFSAEAAARGRETYGLTIIHSDIDEKVFPERSFDLVIAIDLIEHLRSPRTLIAAASKWMGSGGRLVVICPNGRALNFWGRSWIGVQEHMEHLTYLTRTQFLNWGRDFGFEVEKHSYAGCPIRNAQYRAHASRFGRLAREPYKAAYNSFLAAATAVMPASLRHEQWLVMRRV